MDCGDNNPLFRKENPEESGLASSEQSPEMSRLNRLSRFVLERLSSLPGWHRIEGNTIERPGQRQNQELTSYTLDQFTTEQFERAQVEFLAWYEAAQNPETALSHPLIIEHFKGALDSEATADILEQWRDGLDELQGALEDTRNLLESGLILSDYHVKKILSITRHTENIVGYLIRDLDESRSQEI